MKFSDKIFASTLLIAALAGLGVTWACREYAKRQTKASYLSKYSVLADTLGHALNQLEWKSESLLYSAGKVAALEDDHDGLLSTTRLKQIRDDLGVTHLFVINVQGQFIRSTNEDPKLIPNLFSFCPDYRRLLSDKGLRSLGTPIIPPQPEPNPFKFLTVPNASRTRLIEVGLRVDFIGGTLRQVLEQDANIIDLTLHTPIGGSLGRFSSERYDAAPGKTTLPRSLPSQLEGPLDYRFFTKVPSTQPHCCQCDVAGISRGGEYYYVLESRISKQELNATLASIERFFLILGAVSLLFSLVVSRFIARALTRRLERIISGIRHARESKSLMTQLEIKGNDEITLLASEFNGLQRDLDEAHAVIVKAKREAAMGAVARQVSHDIRTPLAALDAICGGLAQLPEKQRLIIRSAISRIRDIANQLLGGYRDKSLTPDTSRVDCYLLSSVIESIITEERLQFRSRIGIEIEARLDPASYGLFSRIRAAEFKRALSNLINNGVEALGEEGVVTVSLVSVGDEIHLKVQDNGKGIPPGLLAQLGQRGKTHGKAEGSGLGLYYARASVESWGGTLDMASEVGKGTTVTVRLPRAEPPAWFISKLELEPGMVIVMLDDDTSIHQVWQERFLSLGVADQGIRLLHFSTPADLRTWAEANTSLLDKSLFLLDYELLGHQETGLHLAEDLGLIERSILVTSRYDEANILAECLRLKMRMIPKGLAGFVPIYVRASDGVLERPPEPPPDVVLLDDDPLALTVWKMAAKRKGGAIVGYRRPEDLLAAVGQIPKETPIYIDYELGNGWRGDAVANTLHAQGFLNLFLATGHPPEAISSVPWLKIVGKEPPWGCADTAQIDGDLPTGERDPLSTGITGPRPEASAVGRKLAGAVARMDASPWDE